jgi:hypothetical protein
MKTMSTQERTEVKKKKQGRIDLRSLMDRTGVFFGKDLLYWMIFSWVLIVFIIMTILPFKGIRYVQWVILPLILLTSVFLQRIVERIFGEKRTMITLVIAIILMVPALSYASPYHKEVSYFLSDDSGMKDLDGQGFREAFEFLEEEGLEGKVSVRWEKLASYYWDNVTGPVNDLSEVMDRDVSFILIYRADVNRDIEPDFTTFARGQKEVFVFGRGGYDILWLYEVTY